MTRCCTRKLLDVALDVAGPLVQGAFSALVALAALSLVALPAQGQATEVSGTVTDVETGNPLPGVNVLVEGTSTGEATDANGSYSLKAAPSDTLVFSFVGYTSKSVPIQGRSTVDVSLSPQAEALDEVVVVAYGTQERADLTSSIATVDVEEVTQSRPVADLAQMLQGTVAGLSITNETGELGASAEITLRGARGSINASAGAQPLILVDGVEVQSLNQLNPNSVESISVLKDAASTAIYGTDAAFGAILITTKYGEEGAEPQVNFSSSFSTQTPTTDLQIAPAAEGARMAFDALQRSSPSTEVFGVVGMYFDEEAIRKMEGWEQQYGDQDLSDEMVMGRDFEIRDGRLYFYRPWNAGEKFMRDWTPMQEHNLSVSGGLGETSYRLGLGYLDQEGVMKVDNNESWKRYNVNLAVNSTVNDWLDVRGKFIFAQTDRTEPYVNKSETYDMWYYLNRWPRVYPYGTYEDRPFRSPVTDIEQANPSDWTSNLSRVSVGGTATLAEGLSLDTDFTYAKKNNHLRQVGGSIEGYNFWAGGGNLNYGTYTSPSFDNVNNTSYWNQRANFRAVATYDEAIAGHSFTLLAGGESEYYEEQEQYSERRELLDPRKGEFDLATGDQYVNGFHNNEATLGFFGRLNYSFDDTYLLQVNGRFDGSSNFPSDDRWGFFPSASVGYKISEEGFMDFAKPTLSFLKFRASYGSVGNNAVGEYPYVALMTPYASDWLVGDSQSQTTFTTPGAVSSALTWETVTTLDLGVDVRLFEGAVNATFDWYDRTTSDMLTGGLALPSTFGAAAPERNFGTLRTRGWELSLGWNHSFNDDTYLNIEGTLSDYTEKITEFSGGPRTVPYSIPSLFPTYYQGRTVGDIWGYVTDRLFTRNDFKQDADGSLMTNEEGEYILRDGIPDQSVFESGSFSFGPGDVKYKDLNGDGEISFGENTLENPGDQKVIGNSAPSYQYGVRVGGGWKGFDFRVFVQGVGSRDLWANGPVFVPGWRPLEAWYAHQTNYWTPENQDAFYPRPTNQVQSSNARNFLPQTRYLMDMSYLRMKNVTLGYTLPTSLTQRALIQKLRIYVSGENLFEFDNLRVPVDPETEYDQETDFAGTFGRVYPFHRTFSLGANLTF